MSALLISTDELTNFPQLSFGISFLPSSLMCLISHAPIPFSHFLLFLHIFNFSLLLVVYTCLKQSLLGLIFIHASNLHSATAYTDTQRQQTQTFNRCCPTESPLGFFCTPGGPRYVSIIPINRRGRKCFLKYLPVFLSHCPPTLQFRAVVLN